ncbi:MAG: Clp protease N-terminal domain-containing protein [Streptosporangiaceae bacterium]
MTPPPTLQELIDTVRRDAGTEDPISQLAVAAATASELEQTTDALLGHFVDRCRRADRSWSEISGALGVTKQAVHKRFAGPLAERLAAVPGRPSFERFTLRARNALVAAGAAAQESGHREIGTGHLLLALYAEPEGVAAKVLLGMQVSREAVETALRAAWRRALGSQDEPVRPADEPGRGTDHGQAEAGAQPGQQGDTVTGRLPMSPEARIALVNAVAVALELRHNYVGTEHILLGLYRNPDSLAARVLAETGPEAAEAQVRVAELLRGYATP